MSRLVLGVRLYRHVPPAGEPDGVTARAVATALGLHVRSAQRHLVNLERAGLVRRDGTKWWRA